ncbi:restriction endonuclease subunit S [Pseudoclavibacter sp. AY1H1]|uniref:restriction endonuclease subunit S n=1 Tax=Pseudoclavibacter sp. AY1H1 TaxID=2080584 RepID=UPI000CE89AC0|nr:restriction endonuclease subunit S [Pseudoclavibacter sp. AY1H1]PPF33593.1 hypothetical protein C5E05_17305 [Pseudoclavibacter sp. AY1H1]
MSDLNRPLGELITLQRGNSYKSEFIGQAGPVLLGLGTIERNGGFRADNLRTYGGPTSDKILLDPGDLFISLKDVTHAAELLGSVARVPEGFPKARLTQDTVRITLVGDTINADYLYWALRTPQYRAHCQARGTGTTNLDLSRADLFAYRVRVPQLAEQCAIAQVLGALDDKIAANSKLLASVDDLQRTSYLSASTNGASVPLSSLGRFVNGRALTKGASGTGRVVIRIAEMNSGLGGSTVYSDAEVPADHVAAPGDILFAWSGSLTLARWFRDSGIINQHIFKVLPNADVPAWLIFEAVRSKLIDFKQIAADKTTTMGHIQRRHLDEPVQVPTPHHVAAMDERMQALWALALTLEREKLTLAETRDALLPHLMSGRLTVRDAEKTVEDLV